MSRKLGAALLFAVLLAACESTPPSTTLQPSVAVPERLQLHTIRMPKLEQLRTVRVYLPPSYDAEPTKRYPVIYLHDGQNVFDAATSYAGEWGVDETLDAIASETGFEAIAVAIDHGAEARMQELSRWTNEDHGDARGDAYIADLVEAVIPLIDRRYRTIPEANARALVGSSMGGLATHTMVAMHPDVFSKAGVFSPSYWYADDLWAWFASRPLAGGQRLYLYMGGGEGDEAVRDAERMNALLAASAQPGQLAFRIVAEAEHNERAWRAEFPALVRWWFVAAAGP